MWNYLIEKLTVTYKFIMVTKLLSMSVAEPLPNHKEVRNHDPGIVLVLLTHSLSLQNDLLGLFKPVVYLSVSQYVILLPFNQFDDNVYHVHFTLVKFLGIFPTSLSSSCPSFSLGPYHR